VDVAGVKRQRASRQSGGVTVGVRSLTPTAEGTALDEFSLAPGTLASVTSITTTPRRRRWWECCNAVRRRDQPLADLENDEGEPALVPRRQRSLRRRSRQDTPSILHAPSMVGDPRDFADPSSSSTALGVGGSGPGTCTSQVDVRHRRGSTGMDGRMTLLRSDCRRGSSFERLESQAADRMPVIL
jgi:hypothetical protein